MSSIDVTVTTGVGQCSDCGARVEGVTVLLGPGGRRAGPAIVCDDCRAAQDAREGAQSYAGRVIRTMEDWLESIGVNTAKHGHATLENFDPSEDPGALVAVRAFVEDAVRAVRHQRVRGVYLAGLPSGGETGHGHGKSHLAVAAIREIRKRRPEFRIMYEPADRLVSRVQDSYQHGNTDRLIELRATADVYVLDDLGREKATADALRVMCTILDEREGRPTVVTSNALPHAMGERHEDEAMWQRVESRLGDAVYRFAQLSGRDQRFRSAS